MAESHFKRHHFNQACDVGTCQQRLTTGPGLYDQLREHWALEGMFGPMQPRVYKIIDQNVVVKKAESLQRLRITVVHPYAHTSCRDSG